MNLILDTWCQADCTLGRLSYGDDFRCFTLELPWLDNRLNLSCFPAGTYEFVKYQSPSKGDVLLLKDVPGRTWIEFHAGNFTRQILGCVLVGDGIKYLDADDIPDVTNSKTTLTRLLEAVPETGTVEVRRTRSDAHLSLAET